ncbi:MAG: energy-coupling factor transporter ATPase [Clostridia bacterium]|nr:energy-coupling factor transporter ATPase [Clostridia bacterium]
MDTNEKLIEIKNVEFLYESTEEPGGSRVLKDVSLDIKKGEFLAVLGHNGSGKSTLAKHLNAILVPEKGSVLVAGFLTSDESLLYEIRQRVGMVFQNPDNQLVATIVEEDVAFAPENLGVNPQEIRERVDYALDAVNMSEYKEHAPHMLSGGQKQRIAIAGVLAMKPDVLVMDEPTAMLDPEGRREILETVKKLNRDEGMTVVMITHFMEEAAQADRVVVIDHGKIIMHGLPKEVFSRVEEIKEIGLDVPQATELAYLLKKEGFDFETDILTADECVNKILSVYQSERGADND